MDIQKVLASIAIILVAVGVLILGGGIHFWQKSKTPTPAQTACTEEAKLCPDGSSVGRTGPNCEFAACPALIPASTSSLEQKGCTQEAKICPDGTGVGRTGPNCEFAPCPSSTTTSAPPIVGGKCSYDSFEGQCKITFIEGSDVKFLFTANEPKKVSQTWFNLQDGKTNGEINFSDTNSTTFLSPSQCIEKYGIKINETIDCKLNVENFGTCTPSMIRFDNIGQECLYF